MARTRRLVVAARLGERSALHALLREHSATARRLALRLLRNEADADEVLQEALMSAATDLADLADPEAFGAWLGAIVVRKAHRLFRRRRRFAHGPPVEPSEDNGSTESAALLQDLARAVAATLAPAEQQAWALRRIGGHALAEVAEACGISVATAKRWIAEGDRVASAWASASPTTPRALRRTVSGTYRRLEDSTPATGRRRSSS